MPIPLVIACIVLLAASIGAAAYWGVVIGHIERTVRKVPTLRDGLGLPGAAELRGGGSPRVCVFVPAHNEEGVVGKLAASLVKQQYPNLRVVFCLDRCTDGTAQEVRHATGGSDQVSIVEIRECPADWAGKVHAVWKGVRETPEARSADILLFTDADTVFDPECVRAAVALLRGRGLGMLSVLSTLTWDRWFERIAQGAAGIELVRQYPLVRANARTHRRAFANGQFLMFTREAYEKLGGHEAVKDAVLEDIELARLAERRGVAAGLFLADGLLRCRMYGDYGEFVKGWKRIYIEAANRRMKRLRTNALRVRVPGTVFPVMSGAAVGVGIVAGWGDPLGMATAGAGVLGLLVMAGAVAWSYRLSNAPLWTIVLYPIGAWRVGGILLEAARDLKKGVPVRWGGREYVREAR